MERSHLSFDALATELIARLPSATSAQEDVLVGLATALSAWRIAFDRDRVVPIVRAPRGPSLSTTHPRNAPLPHAPPALVRQRARGDDRTRDGEARPIGIVALVAGVPSGIYEGGLDGARIAEDTFRDGDALEARFMRISGLAVHGDRMFVTDSMCGRLRFVQNGVVHTFAGSEMDYGTIDGPPLVATFGRVRALCVDVRRGRLLVADDDRVRAVALSDGTTTTVAGGGDEYMDCPAAEAGFECVNSVLVAPDGVVFLIDSYALRKICNDPISNELVVVNVAGSLAGDEDGRGDMAPLKQPTAMTLVDKGRALIVCDDDDRSLLRVDLATGQVATIHRGCRAPQCVTSCSDGTLYTVDFDGVHEISGYDGAVSLIVGREQFGESALKVCLLDESHAILYVATTVQVFALTVRTAGERRAARVFPLVVLWALVQRDRAAIALVDEEARVRLERSLLSRLMGLRVVGIFDRILRFAFM